MHTLNWVDVFIVAVIALSVVISLIRGFVREALSLAGWIVAAWVAISFCGRFAVLFQDHIKDAPIRMAVAFAILFILTLIVAALVNHLISGLVVRTGLSGTDRLLGAIFGFLRGALLIALLIMLSRLTPLPEEQAWKDSMLVPMFKPVEIWLKRLLPTNVSQKLLGTGIQDEITTIPNKN